MMKQPNSNLSEEHALRIVLQPNEDHVGSPAPDSYAAV